MAKEKDVIPDTGVVNIETIHSMMKECMEDIKELKKKVMSVNDKQETMKEEFSKFKKEPAAEPLKRNSKPVEYQFGSGDSPRVQMLEALRGHLKNK
jgi:ribosome-binding ATPase YchF (GTP1/OBG family)